MKGQRLFVRPIEASDRDAVRRFLADYAAGREVPRAGLLGKLVGDLVAVLAMTIEQEAIRVDDLVVAPELRRKRIGRVMIEELAAIAAKMERGSLVVEEGTGAREFLVRTGFKDEKGRMVRRVGGNARGFGG
ncbi:MAG TPA: GNAT family N-acetyltransferase [Thermoanaerobaculia bacterium]|nr:GNAT family N-acetyltransferase [Thermoanaerobaculia bacterium]